jgi:hypothetical protein
MFINRDGGNGPSLDEVFAPVNRLNDKCLEKHGGGEAAGRKA